MELTVKDVREMAKRHGYKTVHKRGESYHVISHDGEGEWGSTLEGIAAHFNMIDTAIANGQTIEYRTPCGMLMYSCDPATGISYDKDGNVIPADE